MIPFDAGRGTLAVLLSAAALLAACGGTPTPILQATATPAPPTEMPTPEGPPDGPSPTSVVPIELELASDAYRHPEGLFSLRPPEGWELMVTEASAEFRSPDDALLIEAQSTYTGYALAADAFTAFVEGREGTLFAEKPGFVSLQQEIAANAGTARSVKQVELEGQLWTVRSSYVQGGAWIHVLESRVPSDSYPAYEQALAAFEATFDAPANLAAGEAAYSWVISFTGPRDLFSFDVPVPWKHEILRANFVAVDSFISPDGRAQVQSIVFDDGTTISRAEAGTLALAMLRDYYAEDVDVVDDLVQPDGSERLTWVSPSGEFTGVSFFETQGTTFLMLTLQYEAAVEDIYLDLLTYLVGTYNAP